MGRFRFRIKEHTIFYRTGLEPLDLEFRGLNRSNGDRDLMNIRNSIIQESALEIKKHQSLLIACMPFILLPVETGIDLVLIIGFR